MKIFCLAENTSIDKNFDAEHGLSLYIETEKHKILFDMGQTDIFCENAKKLGIDLSKVDVAVLSHGHYDHGGGLEKFLEINNNAKIFVHKDAFLPHYNGTEKYIGLDVSLKNSSRIIFTENAYLIDNSLSLFTCNDRERKYPIIPSGLNEKVGEEFIPDDFRHEQYLLIKESKKRILISGCSHKGIIDITEWFLPDILVGGFHYSKLELDECLKNNALKLAKFPTLFYTCHCTGIKQYEFMKKYIKNLNYLSGGQIITV